MANSPQKQVSGKLVILGIVTLAVLAAGASWLFRFSATHRAAKFWGPEGSQLIRDAPSVSLTKVFSTEIVPVEQPRAAGELGVAYDISKAHGLLHLRNALLEDRGFEWIDFSGQSNRGFNTMWRLEFSDDASQRNLSIDFTPDCNQAAVTVERDEPRWISTEPIATGLRLVFEEFWSQARDSGR